ncbi:MAG: Holliday junction branch migration protein RuvA [Microvirga sp.]
MIAQLHGRIVRKDPQEVVVDTGGVGYRVFIPVSTFYRLPDEGAETRLRIHTHVREDALALFGFLTETEHDLFEKLIGVAGVGPKLAVTILSGMEAPDLVDALRAGDLPRLVRIPGVGRKTAERLVLELKDKLPTRPPTLEPGPSTAPPTPREDLILALVHLGYSRPEAERGADRAHREQPDARFEELLRLSLRSLALR